MSKEPVIVNYIDIAGEKKPVNSFSVMERKKLAGQLQDQMMRAAGYERKLNTDGQSSHDSGI